MRKAVDLVELDQSSGNPVLRRLRSYRGAALEVGWMAVNMAVWPVALVDEAVRSGARRVRIRLPAEQLRLKIRPARDSSDSGGSQLLPRVSRTGRPLLPPRPPGEVPILLVHGYFHNRSGLLIMERALRKHGFKQIQCFTYNPLRKDVGQLAVMLKERVEALVSKTGSQKIHLIGHSLGGLVCRYYIEQLGGGCRVHTVVTIGTPHEGTVLANRGRSAAARQMRPSSELVAQMKACRKPKSVRYLSYYSNLDAVVPVGSAVLSNGNGSRVKNILVHDLGHMSLLTSPRLLASIATHLSELS